MFLPFLPHLIILAGIGAMLGMEPQAEQAALSLGELLEVCLGLILVFWLLGLLPRFRSSLLRRAAFSPNRLLVMIAWLGLVSAFSLPTEMQRALAGAELSVNLSRGLTLMMLAFHFLLCDALATMPYPLWRINELKNQGNRLLQSLRFPLPLFVLVLLGLTLPQLDMATRGGGGWLPDWLQPLLMLGLTLLFSALAVPVLIRFSWGLRPLKNPETERIITGELSSCGVKVGKILAWPEEMMGGATAGVIGLMLPFRYLLVSNTLANHLEEEELRSVIAHEAGHLKHGHLWFMLLGIVGFLLLVQSAFMGLFWLDALQSTGIPDWLYVALEIGALVLFLRFGMGAISRNFERQADGHALIHHGLAPFQRAILKVAHINHIAPQQDNWHHHGIARRIDYLKEAEENPARLKSHDTRVNYLKLGLAAFALLSVAGLVGLSSPPGQSLLIGEVIEQKLARIEQPQLKDLPLLQLGAFRALQNNQEQKAIRYLRMILTLTPSDSIVQNNLAWTLVTGDHQNKSGLSQKQRLSEGLRLAKVAAEANESAFIWDTLAEAYHRDGQYAKAGEAAAKALRLAETEQGRGDAPLDYYQQRVQQLSSPPPPEA